MPLTLLITEGPCVGTVYTFQEHATFLVGRALDAHFRLPDDDRYFSRRHFIIEINPPQCRLIDLKSRNGTLVNGVRVQTADLKDGDRISGGKTCMVVRLDSEIGSAGSAIPQPTLIKDYSDSSQNQTLPGDEYPHALLSRKPADFPVIPGYEIHSEIGRGGMGVVYRGVRQSDNLTVAIKTILPQVCPTEHTIGRFLREASTVRQLRHPGIVAGLDSGEHQGVLWFAMEFIDGKNCADILDTEGPVPIQRGVEWIIQLLGALGYAHSAGFVHRDVKPANIIVSPTPAGEKVILTDFGLSRAYQVSRLSGLTLAGTSGGTPKFMPPEQVLDMRSVRPAGDQFSAAATLYHLLTGKYLFDPGLAVSDWFLKILEGDPTPIRTYRPQISESLAAVIHQALARKPEARFPDVARFAAALRKSIG